MKTKNLIAIDEFCANHNIEIIFIRSLQQSGLIEIMAIKGTEFIDANQLQHLEKMIRFYYEFDINLQGIETITYLLQRINAMQDKIIVLSNRLHLYETEF